MTNLLLSILLVLGPGGAAGRPAPAPPTIDWPEFFASVSTTQGVVFSNRLKALEGERVRLRGYSVTKPPIPGALLLTRIPYAESDPHQDGDELDLPYDAVGVVWRKAIAVPPVPRYPTVEGVLRLGNRTLGRQIVVVILEDAVPVYSAEPGRGKAKS